MEQIIDSTISIFSEMVLPK